MKHGKHEHEERLRLVAQHRSGTVRLYRRESDGQLVRVTRYARGHVALAVPEAFLASVRAWSTWDLVDDEPPEGRLV